MSLRSSFSKSVNERYHMPETLLAKGKSSGMRQLALALV
jgi:hypothetical protein